MVMTRTVGLLLAAAITAGCEGALGGGGDTTRDRGFDRKSLTELKAGIWVDPNGCDHWIIDDGLEGYMTLRLTPDGKPVCSGAAPPNHATADFRDGSPLRN